MDSLTNLVQALSFDGVDDIMESSHVLQLDDFTIEMWVHPPASVLTDKSSWSRTLALQKI